MFAVLPHIIGMSHPTPGRFYEKPVPKGGGVEDKGGGDEASMEATRGKEGRVAA